MVALRVCWTPKTTPHTGLNEKTLCTMHVQNTQLTAMGVGDGLVQY